jgi:hypothetical protein
MPAKFTGLAHGTSCPNKLRAGKIATSAAAAKILFINVSILPSKNSRAQYWP